jgi:hypothetical protein
MPEFNRRYTYGIGRFSYIIQKLEDGSVRVMSIEGRNSVQTDEAVKYHLTKVATLPGFRYID